MCEHCFFKEVSVKYINTSATGITFQQKLATKHAVVNNRLGILGGGVMQLVRGNWLLKFVGLPNRLLNLFRQAICRGTD
jgi:hypothetical protein